MAVSVWSFAKPAIGTECALEHIFNSNSKKRGETNMQSLIFVQNTNQTTNQQQKKKKKRHDPRQHSERVSLISEKARNEGALRELKAYVEIDAVTQKIVFLTATGRRRCGGKEGEGCLVGLFHMPQKASKHH